MIFTKTSVDTTVEILASDDFQAIPAAISGSILVPAGMPIAADGAATPTGAGAVGILLYDVDPNINPNAALVVAGIVDWAKCRKHSGATGTAEQMASVLPRITFRTNIEVNEIE